jgi:ubiquinone/menaquinone biosynthesis C-methylase UbiE
MKGEIPLERLDELLRWFDEGRARGIDEAYRRFNEVWMKHPTDLPADPFSTEYAARYFDIYRRVSGREIYDPAVNERAEFDPKTGAMRPFPFQGGSTKLAGEHLGYMARLLDMLDVPPGGEILEMGVGWGNTTLTLAMLDFNLTALDIEERYLEVIRLRSEMHNTPNIKRVHSDFFWVERTDQQFDAVIFFESFHHCREFERLLRALHRVVKPGGKVYFGAEPINRYFGQPWCVRLDGQSLLVARQNGWMELGFHSDFFAKLLQRTGWLGMETDHPHFWKAQRGSEPFIVPAADGRIGSQAGTREDGILRIAVAGGPEVRSYAVFGPGIKLPAGRYRGEIGLVVSSPLDNVVIDACCDRGTTILGSKVGATSLEFELEQAAADVEVRLLVPGGFTATMSQMTFQSVD